MDEERQRRAEARIVALGRAGLWRDALAQFEALLETGWECTAPTVDTAVDNTISACYCMVVFALDEARVGAEQR